MPGWHKCILPMPAKQIKLNWRWKKKEWEIKWWIAHKEGKTGRESKVEDEIEVIIWKQEQKLCIWKHYFLIQPYVFIYCWSYKHCRLRIWFKDICVGICRDNFQFTRLEYKWLIITIHLNLNNFIQSFTNTAIKFIVFLVFLFLSYYGCCRQFIGSYHHLLYMGV